MLEPRLSEADMADVIYLELPLPPSVNAAYRNVPGRGRAKTREYVSWLQHAALEVRRKATGTIEGSYAFHLKATRPDRRPRDLGNLEKCAHDLCVSMGLVEDDSLCRRILLEWSDDPPTKNATVKIWLVSTKEHIA